MKNVTGVDLCRGLAGSWGTLAVMSEVTFKVLPMPETPATVVLLGLPDEIAVEVLCTAMGTPFEVSGAVHLQAAMVARLEHEGLRGQGQAVTALRIENFTKSVDYRKASAEGAVKAYGEIHDARPRQFAGVLGRIAALSVLQGERRAAVAHLHGADARRRRWWPPSSAYMDCRAFYDWAGGLIGSRCWRPRMPALPTSAVSSPRTAATPR